MQTAIFSIADIHMSNLCICLPANGRDLPDPRLAPLLALDNGGCYWRAFSAALLVIDLSALILRICISGDGPQGREALHVGSRLAVTIQICIRCKRPTAPWPDCNIWCCVFDSL